MLFPHLEAVLVEQLVLDEGVLRIVSRTRDEQACTCPGCGTPSRRTHSRYERRLSDAPVGGRRSVIALSVQRLFRDNSGCTRVTFAEQVEGLSFFYGRRTPLLRGLLEAVGVALVGRAGGRLAAVLSVPVDRSVLLRLVMALPEPSASTPRVLGVDDFATRKGHVYGTLLVDAETHAPIDVFQGREAGPLARWLAEHPDVEIICRDRRLLQRRGPHRRAARDPGRGQVTHLEQPRQGCRAVRDRQPPLPAALASAGGAAAGRQQQRGGDVPRFAPAHRRTRPHPLAPGP